MFCLRLSVCVLYPTTCTAVDKTRKNKLLESEYDTQINILALNFITSTCGHSRSIPHVQIVHADFLAKGTIC